MLPRRSLLLLPAALAMLAAPVFAQDYPTRPVKLVVPYPAGGPVDAVARIIAQGASQPLGGTIVVENMGGASGLVGAGAVAKAEPDGYSIVLGTNQTHATNESLIASTPYRTAKDFAPIAQVAAVPHVLVARKDLPADNLADLLKLARDKPGTLNYGSTGIGSASHLAAELFKVQGKLDIVHVPFKGAAPMTSELIAGRLDIAFATLPSVIGQIESGNLKALAVASDNRAAALPKVQTVTEGGVPGVSADAWFALFAPAGTPKPIIDRLHKAVVAALSEESVKAGIAKQGMVLTLTDPARLGAFIPAEVEKWAGVIKAANVPAQ